MLETFIIAFTTLFAVIGPISVAAMFAALTPAITNKRKRMMALRSTLIGAGLLAIFALLGDTLLQQLGISLAALRTAGGVLLLLIGIDMVFARPSGGVTATVDETQEASEKEDIAVFPLATPLIAGPGAIGAVIILMANAKDNIQHQMAVLGASATVLLLTLIAMLGASQLHKLLGVTGLQVISRILGILLSALAVQFVFDGILESGLILQQK